MKILFLNPTGQMGGAEAALLEVMAGLADRFPSWPLALIAGSDGPLVARAAALGVDVRVLRFPTGLARLGEMRRVERWPAVRAAFSVACVAWPLCRYRVALRRLIRELAPDVVHSNGVKMHVLGAQVTPPATPLVWHVHDYVNGRWLGARALTHYVRRAAAVIVPSRSVAADIRALRAPLPPIHTIANAVDLTRFSPAGDRLDLDARAGLAAPVEPVVRVAWSGPSRGGRDI